MRITGGELCGRRLAPPLPRVRPTQDRVREAIFNALAPLISGAYVLDLYAGAGTLGLEAWSRGAARVTWVEIDRHTAARLERFVHQICSGAPVRPACVLRADACRFLEADSTPWNIILADPPYDRSGQRTHLQDLARAVLACPARSETLLVFETVRGTDVSIPEGLECLRDRCYGQSRVLMLRPITIRNRDD